MVTPTSWQSSPDGPLRMALFPSQLRVSVKDANSPSVASPPLALWIGGKLAHPLLTAVTASPGCGATRRRAVRTSGGVVV